MTFSQDEVIKFYKNLYKDILVPWADGILGEFLMDVHSTAVRLPANLP